MYGTVESGNLPSVSRSNKKLLAVAMAAGLLVVAVLGTAMLTRESRAPEYDELESYDYAPQEEELAGDGEMEEPTEEELSADDEEQDTDEEDADPVELMQELDNQRQMLDEIETELAAAAKAPAKAAAKPAAKAPAKTAAKAPAAASARHAAHAAHNSGSRIAATFTGLVAVIAVALL